MGVENVAESHLARAVTHNKGHRGVIIIHPAVKKFDMAFEKMAKNIRTVVDRKLAILNFMLTSVTVMATGLEPTVRQLFQGTVVQLQGMEPDDLTHDFVFSSTSALLQEDGSDGNNKASISLTLKIPLEKPGFLFDNLASVVRQVQDEDTLQTVVLAVWHLVTTSVYHFLMETPATRRSRAAEYQFLLLLHNQLKLFFVADGEGLTFEQMNTRDNKHLEVLLALANLPVESIIDFYFEQASFFQVS